LVKAILHIITARC